MKKILLASLVIAALLAGGFYLNPHWAVALIYPSLPEPVAGKARLSAGDEGTIRFASSSPYDLEILLNAPARAWPTTGIGELSLPEGASTEKPVPLMVVVHGSGGLAPGREDRYAKLLNQHGYGAFVIDYYSPRNVADSSYLVKTTAVTEFDVISDAFHALKVLRTHPKIANDRIGIMGMSYGGMAARFAMDSRIKNALLGDLPGFAVHVDVYGPCFQKLNSPAVEQTPYLSLRGTEDASNELPACEQRETELAELGITVETEIYEGAGHAWENSELRRMKEDAPYVVGCTMQYDERGRPFVNDAEVVPLALDASRSQRIVARVQSSSVLKDCVQHGYVVGNDAETDRKAKARLLTFLDDHLSVK